MSWWTQRRGFITAGLALLALAAQRGDGAPRAAEDDQRAILDRIDRRLYALETGQQNIMKTLDAMLEELRIIKVRATR